MRPVTYDFKQGSDDRIGLIAQELEEVIPEVVSGNNIKAVNYIDLIPVLIKAIQEQQIQIDNLKRQLND